MTHSEEGLREEFINEFDFVRFKRDLPQIADFWLSKLAQERQKWEVNESEEWVNRIRQEERAKVVEEVREKVEKLYPKEGKMNPLIDKVNEANLPSPKITSKKKLT